MPSLISSLFIGLLVYAFLYAVMRFAMSTKEFKAQPAEDQARTRKAFKIALVLAPISIVGAFLLMRAPPDMMRWVPLCLYCCLWLLAVWLAWRAYGLGVRRNATLAKSSTGKPLRNPDSVLGSLAALHLFSALGLMALLVAIPAFRLPMSTWAPLIAVLSYIHMLWMHRIEKRAGA